MNINYQDIITIDPRKRSGKPCIRGLRITVYDILEYLALGMTQQEILEDFDYLTKEDIQACLAYAAVILLIILLSYQWLLSVRDYQTKSLM